MWKKRDEEAELEATVRHVTNGRRIVKRQRALVEQLALAGHDVSLHEQTLRAFADTLQVFEDHAALVWSEIAKKKEIQTETLPDLAFTEDGVPPTHA